MPQVFQVLRCYKCMVFQVHQTKKSIKFQCKMCGEKQSIKRHYGLGNGLECRKHVQRLNGIRGELEDSQEISNAYSSDENEDTTLESKPASSITQGKNNSKWASYVDTEEATETGTSTLGNETMYLDNAEVVLELPRKRPKKLGRQIKNQATNCAFNDETENNGQSTSVQAMHLKTNNIYSENKKSLAVFNTRQLVKSEIQPVTIKQEHSCSKFERSVTSYYSQHPSTGSVADTEYTSKPNEVHKYPEMNVKKRNRFVPPAISKDSKWANFVEENESEKCEIEEHQSSDYNIHTRDKLVNNNSKNNGQILFSLCDDDELDDYLSI